jgi:hypothetical protein
VSGATRLLHFCVRPAELRLLVGRYGCDLDSEAFPALDKAAAAAAGLLLQPTVPAEQPDVLAEFCTQHKFTVFQLALAEMGVAEPSEIADVTDEQLTAIGLNALQLKRMRRIIPAAAVATEEVPESVDSQNPSLESVDSTGGNLGAPPAANAVVDESVDVSVSAAAISGVE